MSESQKSLTRPGSSSHQGPSPTRRRWITVSVGVLVGLGAAILWSSAFVDKAIGLTVANGLLGEDAATSQISGSVAATLFAAVAGLAGTFTACNVAVFSALGPMLGADRKEGVGLRSFAMPAGWLAIGAVVVAAAYGAIGAAIGTDIPQLSSATVDGLLPARILQATVVFGIIGVFLIYLGLSYLGAVPDPFATLSKRWPGARFFALGAIIGAFLVGRPYRLYAANLGWGPRIRGAP